MLLCFHTMIDELSVYSRAHAWTDWINLDSYIYLRVKLTYWGSDYCEDNPSLDLNAHPMCTDPFRSYLQWNTRLDNTSQREVQGAEAKLKSIYFTLVKKNFSVFFLKKFICDVNYLLHETNEFVAFQLLHLPSNFKIMTLVYSERKATNNHNMEGQHYVSWHILSDSFIYPEMGKCVCHWEIHCQWKGSESTI